MQLHHKGYLLVLLEKKQCEWDKPLIKSAMQAYQLSGRYWFNHFSIILDELASAGLILRENHQVDTVTDRLMFQYAMSDFGRERMRDTGLLKAY
ncbi:MAG: hypothetical protein RQ982_07920 [Gammaproteobacteria bacterium]|nr:hypothetical protein [Gammaproteobacteria bacterium]